MGGLGILNDHKLEHVPGTALLDDKIVIEGQDAIFLKHGNGKDSHIVLVPQPSDDPNDPLNWPLWRKDLCFASVALGSLCFTAVLVPMLSPATVELSVKLNTTVTAIAQLTGYCLLCVGSFGPFVSAMSRIWGKRPQFLLASSMGIIGTVVCECANSYHSLLAGRLLEGFSVAAYESLIVAFVGDMYFVHQRGTRVTLFQFVTTTFSVLSPIISGAIYDRLGWRYIFHVVQPFLILQLIMVIFFVPETTYHRAEIYKTDTVSTNRFGELSKVDKLGDHTEGETTAPPNLCSAPVPKSLLQRMAIYNGRFSKQNPIKLVIAPFLTLANPATVWGCLTQGISAGWWVATSFVLAQIWGVPPYNLSAESVGYLYVGPFIGGLLGILLMSFTYDPLIRNLAHRNNGVYEPEFRLYPMFLAVITGVLGLFLFGHMIEDGKGYYIASCIHGVYGFSINVAGTVMSAYIVDGYCDSSTEMLIIAMVFKNFFYYALSYWVNNYLAKVGPAAYFDMQGGIVTGIYLLSIPMYFFGKRVRSWWRRYDLPEKFGVSMRASM